MDGTMRWRGHTPARESVMGRRERFVRAENCSRRRVGVGSWDGVGRAESGGAEVQSTWCVLGAFALSFRHVQGIMCVQCLQREKRN